MAGLDVDWTKSEHAEHYLKDLIAKKSICSGSVLQVAQCVNISIPKKNREGEVPNTDPKKSVFKLSLTDGKTTLQALAISHPHISSSTPPGTKIEITQETPIIMNFIELKAQNTRVLGGFVPSLISMWEMQNEVERMKKWGFRTTSMVKDGPPLWKPFNSRSAPVISADIRNAKAMEIVKEQQKESQKACDDPTKAKFDAQRQEVISELAKKSQAKQFGEGKKLLDKGVLDIMNEGFTEEEAEEALRRFKNPQKAIKHLKGDTRPKEGGGSEFAAEKDGRRNRKGRRNNDDEDEDGPTGNAVGAQPSASISLFGFIEAKIKKDDPHVDTKPKPPLHGGDYREQPSQDARLYESNNDRSYNQRPSFRDDRGRGGRGYESRGHGPPQRSFQQDSGRYDRDRDRDRDRDQYGDGGGRGGRGYGGRRGGRGGPRGGNSYRNSGSDYRTSEPPPVFVGLKPNHFPSLGDEKPQPQVYEKFVPQEDAYSSRPRHDYNRENANDRSSKDTYRTAPVQGEHYYRSSQGGNRDFGYDYNPRQNQYQNRGGGGGGSSNNGGRDGPRFNSYNNRPPPPDQRNPGSGYHQQFANLTLETNSSENYSDQWRPSHTMVFSRSKK